MKKAFAFMLIVLLVPIFSFAETQVFHETHKYVMGDNDSKNDARRICFLEVKREILEKAGVYIESRTQVKDYQLTRDEISAYAAAILNVSIENETWEVAGENMAVVLSVKAKVDTASINKRLQEIDRDDGLQNRILQQQQQLDKLEQRMAQLQKKLKTKDNKKADTLRDERAAVLSNIEEIQASSVFDFWKQ